MNGRVDTLLIGALVCLAGVVLPGMSAPQAAATGAAAHAATAAMSADEPSVAASAASPVVAAPAASRDNEAVLPVAAAVAASPDAVRSGVSPEVLHLAVRAVSCAVRSGAISLPPTLTVIDYSRPSVEPRLWVFDTRTGALLFKELVAHGRNTGENMATRFSDIPESRQSSIGLFVTDETYVGSNGYSLRMDGLEPGFNARARERAIVMHGAPYVDAALARTQGRIGRSWGCPALREAIARQVIDTIRGGGVIFSYYPDEQWLRTSRFLNCQEPGGSIVATH